MAVYRVQRTRDYTVMSNYHLKDKGLTLKSKGLLSMILSLPEEWNYTMVIMTGYVDDMSTSNGVSAEYLTELHSFMNGTMVVIIAVVTFVAGIVGALIAKGVFKKHFQKAGIV